MSESSLFNKINAKMKIPEDKYILQCFKSAEKTGVFDISNYTPSIHVCEAISKVLIKSRGIIKLIARDSLLPPTGLAAILGSLKNSKVSEICLTGNNIAAETTLELAKAVQFNSSIKVLLLKWNNMGVCSKSFKAFCISLSKNKSIEYIDLRSNQITSECVVDLSRSLNNNATIKRIDLRWNLLDRKGAEQLLNLMETNRSLVNIQLTGNPIAPEVVSSLGNCAKYKDGLKSIQSSYEAKLGVLTKHIREIENKRIEHVDKLCQNSKKHIRNAEIKISDLTRKVAEKEIALNEISHRLKETEISLNTSKNKEMALDSIINEKETNYLDLINQYQKTIENLRQELIELENDVANRKVKDEKKYLDEKWKREQAESELEYFKKLSENLKDELDRSKEEFETKTKIQIETLEKDKTLWQNKYNELNKSSIEEIEKLTALSMERQRKQEKTILSLTENQAKNMEAVNEKLDFCIGEKATTEGQLTSALASLSRLQQENSELLNQLAQPSRRLAHVLQELADEKITNEKLRHEKAETERKLEESRQNSSALKEEMAQASEAAAEVSRNQRQQIQSIKNKAVLLAYKLKERDRLLDAVKEEERKRALGLYTAVTSFMDRIPNKTEQQ